MPRVRRASSELSDSVFRIHDKESDAWYNYRGAYSSWSTWVKHPENARFYKRVSDAVNSLSHVKDLKISEGRFEIVEFRITRTNRTIPLEIIETYRERQQRVDKEMRSSGTIRNKVPKLGIRS